MYLKWTTKIPLWQKWLSNNFSKSILLYQTIHTLAEQKFLGMNHGRNHSGDLLLLKVFQKNAIWKYSNMLFLSIKCQRAWKNTICYISGVYLCLLANFIQILPPSSFCPWWMVCCMTLTIKAQTKAAAVLKGIYIRLVYWAFSKKLKPNFETKTQGSGVRFKFPPKNQGNVLFMRLNFTEWIAFLTISSLNL